MEEMRQTECNVGGADRITRIVLGTGLIAAGVFVPMKRWASLTLETLGLVSTATGIGQYCPVSKIMGMNTCELREQMQSPEASVPA